MPRQSDRLTLYLTLALAFSAGVSPAAELGQARFIPLGDLPGGVFRSRASAISADGSAVFGGGIDATGAKAFHWTETKGMQVLPGVPSTIHAVSDDGSVIVGSAWPPGPFQTGKAYRWTPSEGIRFLGDLPGGQSFSEGFGVSSDGSVVVGLGSVDTGLETNPFGEEAFRWTLAGGMIGLGVLDGFLISTASGISADGSIVVGESGGPLNSITFPHQAFRWTAAEGMVALENVLPGGGSAARAISPDGGVIVGWGDNPYPRRDAVFWTETGEIVRLGALPHAQNSCCDFSTSLDASIDGSVIVGVSGFQSFIWDADHGMRDLKGVLSEGLDLSGWRLTAAVAVSHDGRSIAGNGINPDGNEEAWLAVLPPGDADEDGVGAEADLCPSTPAADVVDPSGCSVGQLCPCSGPGWRNHGEYVSCAARVSQRFVRQGFIGRAERRSILREAGRSTCGKPSRVHR